MNCQFCNERPAVNSFMFNYMGNEQEIHLCAECTRRLYQYYRMAHYAARPDIWPPQEAAGHRPGDTPFPENAGDDVRQRRQLNGLRARLDDAVAAEHYEEAARLRDEIAQLEKEVYAL